MTPAEIEEPKARRVQELAVKIHQAIGCSGYSRSDFILMGDDAYYLETNTLPGLSPASFIPQQLNAAKIPMLDFLTTQMSLALSRYT